MKIPVFVSCPTTLSETQLASKKLILDLLDGLELEPRSCRERRILLLNSHSAKSQFLLAIVCCIILGLGVISNRERHSET